jgi:lipopolysaccharide export system permease protein
MHGVLTILDRYIIGAIVRMAAGVTLVLLVLLVGSRFVRYLGPAASGEMAPEAIARLLVLSCAKYVTVLVPLALFIAALLAIGRLHRESEAYAIAAAGAGPGVFVRPLLWVGVSAAVILAWLSLNVAPWASREMWQVREQAEQVAVLSFAGDGRFRRLRGDSAVFYAQRAQEGGDRLDDVFVRMQRNGVPILIVASGGRQQRNETTGEYELVLEDGTRYAGVPGSPAIETMRFAEHGLRHRFAAPTVAPQKTALRSTAALLADGRPADLAELHWRLATPVMTLLLLLFAYPLARSGPRGRAIGLVAGIVLFLAYSNLLSLGQSLLLRKTLPASLGLWWVHGGFLLLLLGMFAWPRWRWR